MRRECFRAAKGVLICWLVGLSGQAIEPPALTLTEIVVTPLRQTSALEQTPYSAWTISRDEPGSAAFARSTADMLRAVPSVLSQKTARGQDSPFLRGFTGFRTMIMVDGIRLNHSVFREGPNQYLATVDPDSIDRLEVALGPASVLYGSDAIGGAINALPVRSAPAGAARLGAQWRLRYATAEDSTGAHLRLQGRATEELGWVTGASYREHGDLRGGRTVGRQRKTAYDEWSGHVRVDWEPTADRRLTVAHQTIRQDDVWRTHRTIYGLTWKGLQRGTDLEHVFDQGRDLTWLRWQSDHGTGRKTWSVYRHAHSEDLLRVASDGTRRAEGWELAAWGLQAQWIRDGRFGEWTAGADYQREWVDSYGRRYDAQGRLTKVEVQGPVADDAEYDLVGVYAQNRLVVAETLGTEAITGARYTFARAAAGRVKNPLGGTMTISDSWDNLIGTLRIRQPLGSDDRSSVFAGISQAFRAPNLSDLTRFDIARSGELESPSPGLDPERFVTAELGARIESGALRAELSLYHTWIDGMIVRAPTGRYPEEGLVEVVKKNAGDGYVQGVEGAFDLRLPGGWSWWTRASWMEGEVDGYPDSTTEKRREPVSRSLPATVHTGLRWQQNPGGIWFEVAAEAAEKADRLSASDRRDTQRIPPGGTPAYAVLHLRGAAAMTSRIWLEAALENVLDADYRIHGSGVNEPGRNVVVSTRWTF